MAEVQIVWLRRDLRLSDQAALACAAAQGPVIPVYVLDDGRPGDRRMGGASRWYLHHALDALSAGFGRHRSLLILRRGDAVKEIARVVSQSGAASVHAIRHYEPWWVEAEKELGAQVDLCLHDGNYLLPPGKVTTGSGRPYKIYTPFAKALYKTICPSDPLIEPSLSPPEVWPDSEDLRDWSLLPAMPDWAGGLREAWVAGETAANERLVRFLEGVGDYERHRNLPSIDGSSRLSPYLHFGEISPLQVWRALDGCRGQGAKSFRGELIWRDYAQNVIRQFPGYPEKSYRDGYGDNLWRHPDREDGAAQDMQAWRQGKTGYPIVDAGMRQLWATGWMHNRVRMIAASFLVKHLLIDWRCGERWFWDTLVDADYANNGVNWQWVAGTGVDANMFPRIMAPLSQSEKFDAAGYIRRWIPELAGLPDDQIHDPGPFNRPAAYPDKIIGHREGRERALAAYRRVRKCGA